MKRFFNGWSVVQILGAILVAGALAYLIGGPVARYGPFQSFAPTPAFLAISFGVLAAVLLGLSVLFRALPFLAYRERRRPDGFEWGRPPVQRLVGLATVLYLGYLATDQSDFAATAWRQQDWPRIVILGLLTAGIAAGIVLEIRRMFSFPIVLSVTADGLMAGRRTLNWSQVEAVVFDRYRWHEFGVVLAGDDDHGSREWWFSLRDAGIEAPHFLDRLERAAPQIEVLKPSGEPMAGAHPIPAA
ncbi:MAG: hypothetical protein JWR84_4238 [Caulobacter sp.]|nr:hypothetical protein [Caulobacter sp.]